MDSPIDQDTRDQALGPQSFIVQAPAGSGKTELLTRRVLTLLCRVDEPEEILAITFTRKAASEMRQRVVETLRSAANAQTSDDAYERAGLDLARQVLKRDRERNWQLLANPQRLNLRTIDALATQLAHRLPITSTLGAPTALANNASLIYQEAARRFIESNIESLDLVLLHLGNNLDRAQGLLAELLSKRDQWQRHVYSAQGDHEQLRQILEGMLSSLIESRLQHLCECIPKDLDTLLLPRLASAIKYATHACDVTDLCPEMQIWSDMEYLPGSDVPDMILWESIAFALLTASNQPRKRFTKNEGFPAKGDAKKLGVDAGVLVAHKEYMTEAVAMVEQSAEFLNALVEVRKLPIPAYKDEQWALLSQLLTVLPDLLIELQLVFSERSVVDFSEISARAALALGSADAPTDLALSMDLSLKHLLVDEFQDTSQTQFRLFEQLIGSWEAGDGRTFFAVGDPMQSIYRFREGDVALFTQVQQHGIGDIPVTPLTLSVNFRAAPAITQWVNDSFGAIFPQRADTNIGAVPYSRSEPFRDYEGLVKTHPLVNASKVDEASHVAQLCLEAIADDPKHQVAILVRSRTQAKEIFDALRQNELSFEAVDMDLLADRLVVRDLITLTMALRFPHDRLHWLALLRAPFVGLSLHDLHALTSKASKHTAIIECLRDENTLTQLSDDAIERVNRFLPIIEPAMGQTTIASWVESVWLQLGGPTVCESDTDIEAAERALALLYRLESSGGLWQKSDIEVAIQDLYATPSVPESCQIQVMTLHKSKGLEFDTVILPALDRRSRANSTQLLNWSENTINGNPQLLLAPFEQRGIHPNQRDRINKLVSRAKESCDVQEKLRLLYVACTRAKRQLHLVARAQSDAQSEMVRSPASGSLLAPLWPLVEGEFRMAPHGLPAESGADQSVPTELAMFKRIPSGAKMPEFTPFHHPALSSIEQEEITAPTLQFASRTSRDVGTVLHAQLQNLANSDNPANPIQLAVILRQLRSLGVNDTVLDKAVNTVTMGLQKTLADERGQWILHPHADARCEWELSVPTKSGVATPAQRVVVDRTFVDADNIRWIVDYKSTHHAGNNIDAFLDQEQERHCSQLNNYARIVSQLDKREIRAGLYFPMVNGWREWTPDLCEA